MMQEDICPFCFSKLETTAHILFHCLISWKFWNRIVSWWGFSWCMPFFFDDLFHQWQGMIKEKFQWKVWQGFFYIIVRIIWHTRNKLIFDAITRDSEYVFLLLFHNAVSSIRYYNPSFVYSSMDLLRNRVCSRLE